MKKALAVLCAATLLSLATVATGCSNEEDKLIELPPVKVTVSPGPVQLPHGGQVQFPPVEIILPKEQAPAPTPEAP